MQKRRIATVLMMITVLAVVAASCQNQASLSGTVTWHDTGGGAEGVSVILFAAGDNATMDNGTTADDYTITATDKNGTYSFTGLTAGSYTVYAAAAGLKFDPGVTDVTVHGMTAGIDFTAYEDTFTVPSNGPYTGGGSDCMNGCLPGVNACSDCCMATFDPYFNECFGAYRDCMDECSGQYYNYNKCADDCNAEREACNDTVWYSVQVEFDCPDFMPEQTCPYDCQAWNSASRSCVGAPFNGCD